MSWNSSTLGSVCDLINRGIAPSYVEDGGILVLNQKCIRNHTVNYDLSRRHDSQKKPVKEERLIRAGDVLVNSTGTGTLGRVALVLREPLEPTTVDTHITIVRPKKGMFDKSFFGLMLISIEEKIKQAGEGSVGQTELSRVKLRDEFIVSYPSNISIQKKVAVKLDAIFAEIDKATVAAEANAKNAEALFESYLAQVFENTKDDWNQKELGKITKFIDYRGKTPTKTSDGIRLITAKNVKFGFLNREPYEYIAEKDYESWMTRGIPKKGDVLFTTEAPLANVAQLDTDEKVVFAQRLIILQPQEKTIDSEFLKFSLLSRKVQLQIISKGTGATVKGIKASLLKLIPIDFPSLNRQREVCKVLADIKTESNKLKDYYTRKVSSLILYKNSILKQAFAGELVKE